MSVFDYKAALAAGASEDDVLKYLSQRSSNFDVQGALSAGASKSQLIDYLSRNAQPVGEGFGLSKVTGMRSVDSPLDKMIGSSSITPRDITNFAIPAALSGIAAATTGGSSIPIQALMGAGGEGLRQSFNAGTGGPSPKTSTGAATGIAISGGISGLFQKVLNLIPRMTTPKVFDSPAGVTAQRLGIPQEPPPTFISSQVGSMREPAMLERARGALNAELPSGIPPIAQVPARADLIRQASERQALAREAAALKEREASTLSQNASRQAATDLKWGRTVEASKAQTAKDVGSVMAQESEAASSNTSNVALQNAERDFESILKSLGGPVSPTQAGQAGREAIKTSKTLTSKKVGDLYSKAEGELKGLPVDVSALEGKSYDLASPGVKRVLNEALAEFDEKTGVEALDLTAVPFEKVREWQRIVGADIDDRLQSKAARGAAKDLWRALSESMETSLSDEPGFAVLQAANAAAREQSGTYSRGIVAALYRDPQKVEQIVTRIPNGSPERVAAMRRGILEDALELGSPQEKLFAEEAWKKIQASYAERLVAGGVKSFDKAGDDVLNTMFDPEVAKSLRTIAEVTDNVSLPKVSITSRTPGLEDLASQMKAPQFKPMPKMKGPPISQEFENILTALKQYPNPQSMGGGKFVHAAIEGTIAKWLHSMSPATAAIALGYELPALIKTAISYNPGYAVPFANALKKMPPATMAFVSGSRGALMGAAEAKK